MESEILAKKKKNPKFAAQRDRIHPNTQGHWMMAQSLIQFFGSKEDARLSSADLLLPKERVKAIHQRALAMQRAIYAETKPLRPGVPAGGTMLESLLLSYSLPFMETLSVKLLMITHQKIEVRQAPSTEAISSVLTEVVTWLSEISESQWTSEVVSPDVLDSCYLPEEMFIGYLDDEPVSCIVLQARDAIFWPEDDPKEALYVHKLAVAKKARGSGIADQLMAWARDRVKRVGRNYLRLDCRVDRLGLVNYYASKGFERVAIRLLELGEFQLFQI